MSYKFMHSTRGFLFFLAITLYPVILVADSPTATKGVRATQTDKHTGTENQRPATPQPKVNENETPSSTSMERFIPKEKIPADTAISFPVDI
jgi:hypothetical protein